jgi:cellulose synthase/poly-beta-1,6-N-acetylglucosamine synthase-like glycosyltransferase
MLTRLLALSVFWLLFSTISTFLFGTRLRHGSFLRSFTWLVFVIACGDLWAVLVFRQPLEVLGLSLVCLLSGILWIRLLPDWNSLGQMTWTASILAVVIYLAYSFLVTIFSPLHPFAFLLASTLYFIQVFALGISLTFIFETLNACTRLRWKSIAGPVSSITAYIPKVSLHIPAYNEPPEILEATLRAVSRLDYPNYEVLLIDNNTADEETWRPIEALCSSLGPNFKFLHLDRWPGYKSGALNFALAHTAPDAEMIGVIDADYQVQPEYLRETVPYFSNSRVGFLQTPQDYRDYQGNPFFEACYDAYKYFFKVSMPLRNEYNAIIFGGTMGLIRKSVLQDIGGWDEWCITEDAEASLRILKRGYQGIFLDHTYGQGIMPLNFDGLKKQRFRWCFGGIQILRKHWEGLMPWASWADPGNQLSFAQKYFYLSAGLQWFNEPLTFIFTLLLLLGSLASLLGWDLGIRPIIGATITVPFIFIALGLFRFLWTLRFALHLDWKKAWRAMGNFFSLSWVVALAAIQGLIQPKGVFLRTPKSRSHANWLRALRVTQWESIIGGFCFCNAIALSVFHPVWSRLALALLLFWHAGLYLSAPLSSLKSLSSGTANQVQAREEARGQGVQENRAARWAVALGIILIIGFVVLKFFPQPGVPQNFARYQPVEIQPQQLIGMPSVPSPTSLPRNSPDPTLSIPGAMPTPSPESAITIMQTASPQFADPTAGQQTLPLNTPTPKAIPLLTTTPNTPAPSSTPTPSQTIEFTPTPTLQTPATPTPTQLPTQVPTHKPLPSQAPTQKPRQTRTP